MPGNNRNRRNNRNKKKRKQYGFYFDYTLLFVLVFIVGFGLTMIYSRLKRVIRSFISENSLYLL